MNWLGNLNSNYQGLSGFDICEHVIIKGGLPMSNKIFKSLKDSQKSYKICLYCNTENQLHIFLVSTPVFERRLLGVEGLGSGTLVLPFICQKCIFDKQISKCNCPRSCITIYWSELYFNANI